MARGTASGWTRYAFDPEGNVAQRLDGGGNVLSSSVYDAYGAETSTGAAPTDPFGYHARQGYTLDRETGLVLCRNRYYDSRTGRWLTRNPIGPDGGIDLYGYCESGPVGWSDPDSLTPFRLPANPQCLGPEWTKLPHGDPNGGERYLAPGGRQGIEFNPGKKGENGWERKDHWHKLRRDRKGKLEKEKTGGHYNPGDEMDIDFTPMVCPGKQDSMWNHVDWGTVG